MTITVKELREWLESQKDDARVIVGNPFQNYEDVELIDTGSDGYRFENIVIIRGR